MILKLLLLGLLTFSAFGDFAREPKRIALVIGNRDYSIQRLVNPVNDAAAMDAALRGLGFETRLALNVDAKTFEQELNSFYDRISKGDVALFYFSGNGGDAYGQSFLMPIMPGRLEKNLKAVAKDSMQVSEIVNGIRRKAAELSIVIVDADRAKASTGWPKPKGNFTGLETRGAYFAFATDAGQHSDDNGVGKNGLFTQELLRGLQKPGLSLDDLFTQVRIEVAAKTNGKQVPVSANGLGRTFVLNPESTR